jgi:hypothetical protein
MSVASLALALALLVPAVASASPVRDLPYPFDHLVSLSSDVDMQVPWHGASIHRVLNEEIGLPIGDSLWAHASDQGSSALFLGATELNRQASDVGTHPTYVLLLREWHRGNIDHFHSWSDDASATWRWEPDPSVAIGAEPTLVAVESPGAGGALRQNVRMYFDAEPPRDLSLELLFEKGPPIRVPPADLARGRAVQFDRDARPAILEVLLRTPRVPDPANPDPLQPMRELAGVRLKAPSCSEGCARLVRIETGHFSRRTVEAQLPWLEAWNVRPALLTSHGGFTQEQDYAAPGYVRVLERESRGIGPDSPIVTELHPLAHVESSHAYHSDLLHRLGVDTVWRIDSETAPKREVRTAPRTTDPMPPFYTLNRADMHVWGDEDPEAFVEAAREIEPLLDPAAVAEIHCGAPCGAAQGGTLGLLLATSFAHIDAGIPARHLWYTHLGSSLAVTGRTAEEPIRPVNVKWLRELARRHYDFDGSTPPGNRPWVAPATTIARYRIVQPQVANHLEVRGSRVSVSRWTDPVTGRTLPDPLAGSRDLHGITIEVDDPSEAELWIGGEQHWAFTRNAANGAKAPSITVVDDSTPSSIFDEVRWTDAGEVEVESGRFVEPEERRPDAASGDRFASLVADASGRASVTFRPGLLDLWNTTHLHLALRRPAGAPPGQVRIGLRMADGGVVAVTDEAGRVEGDTASLWLLGNAKPDAGGWQRHTGATAELDWAASAGEERPALPLGRVAAVTLHWEGADPGSQLDLDALLALRPATTGESPHSTKLLAGRVTRDGAPVAGVEVEARSAAGRSTITTTDEDGYYFLYGRTPGIPVAITARGTGPPCPPLQGRWIEVRKNEAELDIELAACQPEAPQGGE